MQQKLKNKGETAMTSPAHTITLYDALGGHPALTAAVDDFFARVLSDPVLGPFFPGGVGARHRGYLVTVLGEALGGPSRYRGPDLAGAHCDLGITDAQFDRAAGCLDATLTGLGVPRHLTDRVIGIVAGLRPLIVTG
jgi:hemoglobin